MTGVEFNTKLRAGEQLLGTLLTAQTPFYSKILGDCGLDFVFIDTEHIAIGRESLSWMCRTYAAMGVPPLVRITEPNPNAVTVALDDGASGVVAPYVEHVTQVQSLVGASKLRPLKGVRVTQLLAKQGALDEPLHGYIKNGTAGNTLIVNIESMPAIANLDAILEVDGLDAILIGPHDLSCSLGVPEQYGDTNFLQTVETILTKARDAGIGAGIHFWGTMEEQMRFIEMGANLFIHKADAIFLKENLVTDLSEIRRRLGISKDPGNSDQVNI
jgi:4-hydroxy-2-oxoheptanedioate aldolase